METKLINIRISADLKARATEAAKADYKARSLTAFIIQAMEEKLRRDGHGEEETQAKP